MVTSPRDDRPPRARQSDPGPAPGRLETVRAFVNTLDIESGVDQLGTPSELMNWLAGHDVVRPLAPSDRETRATGASCEHVPRAALGGPSAASAADLDQAIMLREGLRTILLSHVRPVLHEAHAPSDLPLADLQSLAAGLPTRLEITDVGRVRTVAAGTSPAAALAAILLIAADASTLGTWPRLKVCSADDCRWAFYDRSPTRSGCWCSMAVCGSRAKARAYRKRAAARR